MTDSPSLRRSHPRIRSGAAGLVLFALSPVWTQTVPDYELPPIAYSTTDPTNAISEVQRGQDHAQLHLKGATDRETLERCLAALGVPAESQVLVFSKTSLQRRRIEPHSPRAIYFSDDCYVGLVP